MTVVTLAMSENLDEAKLWLTAIANGVDRKSETNLTNFVGILSAPLAFFGGVAGSFWGEESGGEFKKVFLRASLMKFLQIQVTKQVWFSV